MTYLEGQGPARTRSAKCIVSTLDLVAEKPPRQEKEHGRFVGAAFADLRGEWRDLAVACVHAVSKKDPRGRESADRHAAARELRSAVERFAGGRPLAVLGDLNADPYEEELLHEEGWYAFRERERLRCWQDKPGRSHGGPRGLFNPMWGLLRDASPWGTLAYDKRPHTAKLWHHMDQILVSDELADHLAPPEILETLNAEDGEQKLTTAGGKRTRYSDHLPVYAALRVNEVNRCHPSNSN
ncbi:MAG: hypothetical protein HY904_19105 [Deltaproteobacteria bacterium]|nr:hypothetical protein [Deltaproteobacteria bacterium]